MAIRASRSPAIPSLPARSLLGHLPAYQRDRLGLLRAVAAHCGDIGAFRVGPRTLILLNEPTLIHAALVQQAAVMEKWPLLRYFARAMARESLLVSLNSVQRQQRPLVAPAFQHRRVVHYGETMARYAERLQSGWPDGTTIDVLAEMKRLTLWIAGKTLFDADVREESAGVGEALATVLREGSAAMNGLVPLPLHWPLPRNRSFQAAAARLEAITGRLIAERRRSGEDRGDLLSMLLTAGAAEDGRVLTDRQVHDQALGLFLGSFETTASALCWTWYLLAQHPGAYAHLRDEADRVLGGRLPTVADLPALPYALQVFKEALRLYPPAFQLGRYTTAPVTLGAYHLPAHTSLVISPYTLHRRPDYYPAPDLFRPERFTSEAETQRPRHAYLPFGTGPRRCIGMDFALLEGQLVLATLAQRVTFALPTPPPRVVPHVTITLSPRGGLPLVVQRRPGSRVGADGNGMGTAPVD